MKRLILQRLAASVVVLIMASVVVFTLSRASGDPRHLYLSEYTTAKQWEQWGKDFGLDKPYPVQYLTWLKGAVTLDFGKSVKEQIPATTVVRRKIWPTLQLAFGAYFFAIIIGVPLGVLSATKRGTNLDLLARSFALIGQAMPGFWLGIMLILTFAVHWQVLPAGGKEGATSIILPSITLGWFAAAALLRLTRSAMLEVLDSEYVKLARAKGLSQNVVIWKHAFRNAITVPLTYAGLFLTALLTGAVVTETVFAWPGLGRLAIQSVFGTDFPVVSAIVLFATAGYLFMNLVVDILYGILDPRVRHSQ
ncbi:MAG: ABC transporter permease [Planctomycetota bacterium]|nr:ABC transporter permease [Chloroflexota bacterium]MDA1179354.1 ABC transporter permease [Planctomycetota bacterium]